MLQFKLKDKNILLIFKDKVVMINEEIFILLIIISFVIPYFIQVIELSRKSRLFPTFIVVVVSGLILIRLRNCVSINKSQTPIKNFDLKHPNKKEENSITQNIKTFFPLLSLLLLAISLNYFGTYIAVPLFIFLSMLYYGVRNWVNMIFISLGMTLFLYLVFGKWLIIPMPQGIFFN